MSKCIHRFVVTDLLNHRSSHIPSGLSCHKRTVPAGKEEVLLLVFVPGRRTQREYSCERAATCSNLWAASATSERPPSSVALYLYTRRARRDPTVCTSAQHFHNKARASGLVRFSAWYFQNKTFQDTLTITWFKNIRIQLQISLLNILEILITEVTQLGQRSKQMTLKFHEWPLRVLKQSSRNCAMVIF